MDDTSKEEPEIHANQHDPSQPRFNSWRVHDEYMMNFMYSAPSVEYICSGITLR